MVHQLWTPIEGIGKIPITLNCTRKRRAATTRSPSKPFCRALFPIRAGAGILMPSNARQSFHFFNRRFKLQLQLHVKMEKWKKWRKWKNGGRKSESFYSVKSWGFHSFGLDSWRNLNLIECRLQTNLKPLFVFHSLANAVCFRKFQKNRENAKNLP